MISNDIAQLAYLYAQVNSCTKIIFGGFFIRGHAATMHTISFGVNYWSKVRRRVKLFDTLLEALLGHFLMEIFDPEFTNSALTVTF